LHGAPKIDRKSKLTLAILLLVAIVLTAYTASAHLVASHIGEDFGTLYWPTPGYTFLPWPTTPTGFVIQVVVFLNQTDLLYYQYIIKSGVLIVLTLFAWVAVFWKVRKYSKK
jgi:hypothetical protein